MKTKKQRVSIKLIVIFNLIVFANPISVANAADQTPAGHQDAINECRVQRNDCVGDVKGGCTGLSLIKKMTCLAKLDYSGCNSEYSNCMDSYSVTGGGFVKPTLDDTQDVYVDPVVKGNKDSNKNTFVPSSGFIAPPPKSNGSARTPTKPAAPVSKSLVAPLVVPVKKTNTMPTATQPKMKTMNMPTVYSQPRNASPTKHKVTKPAPSSASNNKPSRKQTAPAAISTSVKQKGNKPTSRNMNNKPAIYSGNKAAAPPSTNSNFDEADAIFGKRTDVKNTQSR